MSTLALNLPNSQFDSEPLVPVNAYNRWVDEGIKLFEHLHIFDEAPSTFTSASYESLIGSIWDYIKRFITWIWNTLKRFITWLWEKIVALGKWIKEKIKWLFGIKSTKAGSSPATVIKHSEPVEPVEKVSSALQNWQPPAGIKATEALSSGKTFNFPLDKVLAYVDQNLKDARGIWSITSMFKTIGIRLQFNWDDSNYVELKHLQETKIKLNQCATSLSDQINGLTAIATSNQPCTVTDGMVIKVYDNLLEELKECLAKEEQGHTLLNTLQDYVDQLRQKFDANVTHEQLDPYIRRLAGFLRALTISYSLDDRTRFSEMKDPIDRDIIEQGMISPSNPNANEFNRSRLDRNSNLAMFVLSLLQTGKLIISLFSAYSTDMTKYVKVLRAIESKIHSQYTSFTLYKEKFLLEIPIPSQVADALKSVFLWANCARMVGQVYRYSQRDFIRLLVFDYAANEAIAKAKDMHRRLLPSTVLKLNNLVISRADAFKPHAGGGGANIYIPMKEVTFNTLASSTTNLQSPSQIAMTLFKDRPFARLLTNPSISDFILQMFAHEAHHIFNTLNGWTKTNQDAIEVAREKNTLGKVISRHTKYDNEYAAETGAHAVMKVMGESNIRMIRSFLESVVHQLLAAYKSA